MTTTVVIHQPDFLPHLAFFDRLVNADLFVVFDTAQYVTGTSRSWMNRDRIKTRHGAKWITVPVQKSKRGARIMDMMLLTTDDWRTDGLNLIRENYREAPFFDEIFPYLEGLYRYKCATLMDFNLKSIAMLMALFDIKIEMRMASTLKPEGKGNEQLVEMMMKLGARRYLSGVGAMDYFKLEPFQRAGIELIWQDFTHPVYPQLHGDFIPYLSSIDLLLNCGSAGSKSILRAAGRQRSGMVNHPPLKGICP